MHSHHFPQWYFFRRQVQSRPSGPGRVGPCTYPIQTRKLRHCWKNVRNQITVTLLIIDVSPWRSETCKMRSINNSYDKLYPLQPEKHRSPALSQHPSSYIIYRCQQISWHFTWFTLSMLQQTRYSRAKYVTAGAEYAITLPQMHSHRLSHRVDCQVIQDEYMQDCMYSINIIKENCV